MSIKIDYLKNHHIFIKEISRYFYAEWHYLLPEKSLNYVEESILDRLSACAYESLM
jgi:hypothetical protein